MSGLSEAAREHARRLADQHGPPREEQQRRIRVIIRAHRARVERERRQAAS